MHLVDILLARLHPDLERIELSCKGSSAEGSDMQPYDLAFTDMYSIVRMRMKNTDVLYEGMVL